ncbi:MAG: deoxyribonuclease [Actinomycetota bacterium]|jgi:deoxyribonuclease-4|nr:deoxyribonuclease [Actinomycetota bacterium]
MIIGAHVPDADPLTEAKSVWADCVQLFVGPPQSWKKPPPRDDAEVLKASPVPVYVHAPYLINVASPNNRVRIPSRKILAQTIEAAAAIDATALIVHGGHAEDGVEHGFRRWWKVFDEMEEPSPVPIFIENTAGGTNAMTRHVDAIAQLWEMLADFEVGFCFDTCHAHAAGEDLNDVVKRVLDATGRIDLVHANGSRDKPGSGADRHENFSSGQLDPDAIVEMVKASGTPVVICETPWPGIADDIAYLRDNL